SSCDATVGPSYGSAYSSWYLVKVESPDNLFSISLKYDEEKYSSYTISMRPLDGYELIEKEYSLVKNYMKGVRIAKISTSTSEITFTPGALRQDLSNFNPSYNSMGDDPNTEAKTVGEIQIQNTAGNGISCKKYKFTYSYFEDNITPFPSGLFNIPTTSDKKRLKLEKVQEFSCDETSSVPPYLFNYHTELVPRQISFGQDHWGYYNGVTNNTTLIPTYTVNTYDYKIGADRESRWPEMRGGALNRITYPTGGQTDFEFEPNKTWVNATVYNKVQTGSYQVGYNANNTAIYTNVNFTGNHYRVTITNNNCSSGSYCPAGVYLESNDGSTSYGLIVSAGGGQTATGIVVAPSPGVYRLRLHRDNSTQYGVGATAVFEEIVSAQLQSNVTVGGLRIKKITSHDAISVANNIITEYSYLDGANKSTGILYSKPVYVGVIRNEILRQVGRAGEYPFCSPNGCMTCVSPAYYKSATSIRPMETLQGGHVGYNEVKTFQTGKGSSVYRFYGSDIWDLNVSDVCTRNVSLTCDLSVPNYPVAPLPFEYKRGELKYEGHFNEAGQLLKYSWYYPVYTDNPVKTPGILHSNFYMATFTLYDIATKRKTQMTVDESVVNLQTGITTNTSTATYYESPWHKQPTRTTSTNSKGETVETKYKYSFDFRANGCDAMTDCWQTYQAAATAALNTFNTQLSTCTETVPCLNCKFQALHQHRRDVSEARKTYVACQLSNKTTYTNCFSTAKTNANTDLKPILELQSKNINAPIEVSSWKNGKLLGASFTKYDYSTTVPGMVYPAKAQRINLGAPSTSFTASTVSGTGLIKDNRYDEEATIKMENGNVAEVTGKDGVVTSYIWGYSNTLPVVKATGVGYTTLKAAYDAVSGNLTLLRSQPSLSAAYLSTYVYTPGVGMTSETDSRGRNIYYEYDKMNRLVQVKDHDNNVIKKICYNFAGQPENCLSACTNTTAAWQYTPTAPRCQVNGSNQNTGYQEQEQKDMNPCSPTYNQLRWIVTVYNPAVCPLPPTCNSGNCSGNDKKCINGVCETGTWTVISSYRETKTSPWNCVYAYCFSDGSTSTYTQTVTSPT
ncbi:MAG: hypothetical protein JNM19_06680, partial [Chitinophagaceae bacterium]|nr:hypothetical protein [Chitinophagaceae bacterium]